MTQILPLRTIEYKVPFPAESTSLPAGSRMQQEYPEHLLKVLIDFESGRFEMDGSWDFIMRSNSKAEQHWFGFHRQRVTFNATIYPGEPVDLANASTGAAFAVEGILSDEDGGIEYAGLLLMDAVKDNRTPGTQCWHITLYLYNSESDDCEIKLTWPFYAAARFAELN
jgi:hypothetical protein